MKNAAKIRKTAAAEKAAKINPLSRESDRAAVAANVRAANEKSRRENRARRAARPSIRRAVVLRRRAVIVARSYEKETIANTYAPAVAPFVVRGISAIETNARRASVCLAAAEKAEKAKADARALDLRERAVRALYNAFIAAVSDEKTPAAVLAAVHAADAAADKYFYADADEKPAAVVPMQTAALALVSICAAPENAPAVAVVLSHTPADARAAFMNIYAAAAAVVDCRVYADITNGDGVAAAGVHAAKNTAKNFILRGDFTPRQYTIYTASKTAYNARISDNTDFLDMINTADLAAQDAATKYAAAVALAAIDAEHKRDDANAARTIADAAETPAAAAFLNAAAERAEKAADAAERAAAVARLRAAVAAYVSIYAAENDYIRNLAAIATDTRRRFSVVPFSAIVDERANGDDAAAADILAALATTNGGIKTADDDDADERDAEKARAFYAAAAAAVDAMPARRRSVFLMICRGYSLAETAEKLNTKKSTICGHIADARADILNAAADILTNAEYNALFRSIETANAADKNENAAAKKRDADAKTRAAAAAIIDAAAAANAAENAEKNARRAEHYAAFRTPETAEKDAAADAKKRAYLAAVRLENARAEYAAAVATPPTADDEKAAAAEYAAALAIGYTPAAAAVLANARATETERRAAVRLDIAAQAFADAEKAVAVLEKLNAARPFADKLTPAERAERNAEHAREKAADAAAAALANARRASVLMDAAENAAREYEKAAALEKAAAAALAAVPAVAVRAFAFAARGYSLADIAAAENIGKTTAKRRLDAAIDALAAVYPAAKTAAPRSVAAALALSL